MIRKTATGKVSPRTSASKGTLAKKSTSVPVRTPNGGRGNKATKAVKANGRANELPSFTVSAAAPKPKPKSVAPSRKTQSPTAPQETAQRTNGRYVDPREIKLSTGGKDIQNRDGSWTVYKAGFATTMSNDEYQKARTKEALRRGKWKPKG